MFLIGKPPFKLSEYNREDSEGNFIVKNHAYFAQSAGYVTANVSLSTAAHYIRGYVGMTSNPAGEGDNIRYMQIGGAVYDVSISFLVPKGAYFEITSDSGTPVIWWLSFGALRKPIDFN